MKTIPETIEPGLSFHEMFAYKGQVIDKLRSKDGDSYFVVVDSNHEEPYVLSKEAFVDKFTYDSKDRSWVRFMDENFAFWDENDFESSTV